MKAAQIERGAHERPFRFDPGEPAQEEAIEAAHRFDDPENGLDGALSLPQQCLAEHAVHALRALAAFRGDLRACARLTAADLDRLLGWDVELGGGHLRSFADLLVMVVAGIR